MWLILSLVLLSNNIFAQTKPNISYSPSTEVYTLNTAITGPALSNSGGVVATFAYGTGTQPTGGTFNNPYGMGTDPSGNVYVINYGNNTISKYSAATGTFVSNNYFTGGALSNPAGIAFDNAGNAYILNYNHTNNGQGNHHGNAYVEQYNSAGVYQSTIVQGLGTATSIAIDLNNNIYIAEGSYNGGNQTVAQYNTSGQLAFTLNSTQITNPVGVGVDGAGNIYVLDDTNNDVVKFNSAGTYLSTVITGLGSNVLGIYVDGAGNIYIGNSGTGGATGNTSGSVKVYDSSGNPLVSITGLNDPEGVVTDNKGNMYVSDYTNNTVTRYPPVGGYYLSGLLPAGLSFSSTTGTFSGTPTTTFNATAYTITAYNANGSSSTTVTLSCPDTSTPTISYNPSINVFTTNSAITPLTPTTTHSPTSFSISGTLPTGLSFSTTTGIISGTPTATSAATIYTITCTNANGSGSTTVSIACVIDDYWTGASSTDWNDAGNWSVGVPGPTDLASIGVIAYAKHGKEPSLLTTDGAVSVYYLTFGATHAATLTVQTGASLTVNKILTINTNATPTFTGTGTGAINIVPAAVVNVTGTGVLTISSPLTFTLQSNATSSASVAAMTSGSISGNVTVQRYIPNTAGRGYILLTSPVNYGTADANGNSIYSINYLLNSTYVSGTNFPNSYNTSGGSKPGNPSLYLYREDLAPVSTSFTGGNFRGINTLSASPYYTLDGDGAGFDIPVGNGYLMFFRSGPTTANPYLTTTPVQPATLSATGKLNQGSITFKHWNTPSTSGLMYTTASGNPTIEGFNLVGNPYACTIDLTTYATGGISMTNLSNFVYELDPSSKNYGIYELGGSDSTNHASRYIVSGQGFFVQASSASPTPQLTFNESAKKEIIQNTGLNLLLSTQPIATNNVQYLRLRMAMDTVNIDETVIRFNSNAKSTYTFNVDAPYRAGSGKVSMYSLSSDNKALGINTLPLPKQVQTRISLNVNAAADGVYTLNMADIKSVPTLYEVWLMDAYKKDSVDLRANPTYSFNISKSDETSFGPNRFSLVIRQNPALAVHLLNFSAAKAANGAQVVWTTDNEQNYTNFTVERSTDNGKTFDVVGGMASSSQGTYSLLDRTPIVAADQYRLKMQDLNGAITYSNIVTLLYSNLSNNLVKNSLNIYPNPATSTVNLAIVQNTIAASNNNNTTYNITITGNNGAVVKTDVTSQTNWQGNVHNLLPGTYVIQVVSNKDKSLVGESKFVKL